MREQPDTPKKSWGWNGTIGPSFVIVVGLAALQGMTWVTDGRAAIDKRVTVLEAVSVINAERLKRIEEKLDKALSR